VIPAKHAECCGGATPWPGLKLGYASSAWQAFFGALSAGERRAAGSIKNETPKIVVREEFKSY
jgi:hypothetical protein